MLSQDTKSESTPHNSVSECIRVYTGVYGCMRVYTSVYECIRVYASVFECIRVYTSVYECIRVYTSIRLLCQQHHRRGMVGQQSLVLLPYYSTDVVNCGQYTHLAYNMHTYTWYEIYIYISLYVTLSLGPFFRCLSF